MWANIVKLEIALLALFLLHYLPYSQSLRYSVFKVRLEP